MRNKAITIIMVLLFMFSILIGGCNKRKEKLETKVNTNDTSGREEQFYSIDKQYNLSNSSVACILDSSVVVLTLNDHTETVYDQYMITFYGKDDGKMISCRYLQGGYSHVQLRKSKNEDEVCIICTNWEKKIQEIFMANIKGWCWCIGFIDFSDLPDFQITPEVQLLGMTDEDTLYICEQVYIYAKDSGLERHKNSPENAVYQVNRIYVMDKEGYIKGMTQIPFDVIPWKISDNEFIYGIKKDEIVEYRKIDPDGKDEECFEVKEMNSLEGIGKAAYRQYDTGIFYSEKGEMWKLDEAEGKSEKMVSLSSFGILQDEMIDFQISNADEAGIGILVWRNNELIYYYLKEGKEDFVTLTLAGIEIGEWTDLQKSIIEFNRNHKNCCIKVVDYLNDNYDYYDALNRLQLDFTSGNTPDLLLLSATVDGTIYAKKGLLYDLYELMKNDDELNCQLLVPSVLNIMEMDGSLYSLAPDFSLVVTYGPQSIWGDGMDCSFQTMERKLLEHQDKYVVGFGDAQQILMEILRGRMGDFVDWHNKQCNFDNERFRELMRFIKEDVVRMSYVSNVDLSDPQEAVEKWYRDHLEKNIVLERGGIGSFADYSMTKQLFGDDITIIRSKYGTGLNVSMDFGEREIAIVKTTKHLELAWEFMKFYCKYENKDDFHENGFSIFENKLQEQAKESQEISYIKNEIGELEKLPKKSEGDYANVFRYYVYNSSHEEVEMVMNLINECETKKENHSRIFDIILEESASYFSDEKPAEVVSDIIQNRVNLYLSE